jgi:hypothetical protein
MRADGREFSSDNVRWQSVGYQHPIRTADNKFGSTTSLQVKLIAGELRRRQRHSGEARSTEQSVPGESRKINTLRILPDNLLHNSRVGN